MRTDGLTADQVKSLGQELADNVPRAGFDEMAGRILKHGHMYDNPGEGKTYFTKEEIGVNNLLEWVQNTLRNPDRVEPREGTRLAFKKDLGFPFGAEQSDGSPRSVLTVVIDLVNVPDDTNLLDPAPEAMDQVGWVVAYPSR